MSAIMSAMRVGRLERTLTQFATRHLRRWLPGLVTLLVVALASLLLVAIFLTSFQIQWVAFLFGTLVAACLAVVSRASRARWTIARRTGQLRVARERLAKEAAARVRAQDMCAAADRALQVVDRSTLLALIYVGADRRVEYHNHAFAECFGRGAAAIDARLLSEVMDGGNVAPLEAGLAAAFRGVAQSRVEVLATVRGESRAHAAQYVPCIGSQGGIVGVLVTLLDVSAASLVPAVGGFAPPAATGAAAIVEDSPYDTAAAVRSIATALERDHFSLYMRELVRINPGSAAPAYHEVSLRLDEEEECHLPPGTFLALAEECDMLPALESWQACNIVKWLGAGPARRMQTCGMKVTAATLAGPDFAAQVRAALAGHRVDGQSLCFELAAAELEDAPPGLAARIAELRREGCRFAVTGFGADSAPLKAIRGLEPEYVKIDAGIVFGIAHNPRQAARLAAINRVAHAGGMATIAECVEDAETVTCLRQLGVDFAQGSAMSAARPLDCEHVFDLKEAA